MPLSASWPTKSAGDWPVRDRCNRNRSVFHPPHTRTLFYLSKEVKIIGYIGYNRSMSLSGRGLGRNRSTARPVTFGYVGHAVVRLAAQAGVDLRGRPLDAPGLRLDAEDPLDLLAESLAGEGVLVAVGVAPGDVLVEHLFRRQRLALAALVGVQQE